MFHVEHREKWIELLVDAAKGFGLTLRDGTISDIAIYLREIRTWNARISLTGLSDDREIIVKHFIDSLSASSLVMPASGQHLIDIGSGGGFPGLVLKLVCPELEVLLLEPTHKKAAFLHSLIGQLQLKGVQVESRRVEQIVSDSHFVSRFDWITIRAVEISDVLRFTPTLLTTDGRIILYRARKMDPGSHAAVVHAGLKSEKEIPYSLPLNSGERILTVLNRAELAPSLG